MAASAAEDAVWRLDEALDTPAWLSLSGSYRLRYESLDGAFRAGVTGSDHILVERLLFNARATFGNVFANVELQDSRQQLATQGLPLGTDSVNAIEPLQMLIGAQFDDAFQNGDQLTLSAGRFTMDWGSRRFVGRNSFRNTANAFTGVQGVWTGAQATQVHAFFVLPVSRRPTAMADLLDNRVQLDSQNANVRLWGLHVSQPRLFAGATGEVYVYGLAAHDYPGAAVADRNIYTPGARLLTKPEAGRWDFEAEAALQVGTSRIDAASTRNLHHFAGFFHGHVGYTLRAAGSPHLTISYDYASGDHNPNAGDNNRFDTLYGARRFDYGPTGIYGPFARSNIRSPGLRMEAKPAHDVSVMMGYRAVWLAASSDQWTAANLQDRSGLSGSFLGNQIETELKYAIIPGNLTLEAGGAYFAHGSFVEKASSAAAANDTTYFFAGMTLSF
jgi:hypothetical protein